MAFPAHNLRREPSRRRIGSCGLHAIGALVALLVLLAMPARALEPSDDAPATGSVGTSFFGVKDTGSKFVYVIDRSASMQGEGATVPPFTAAKDELKASIEQLDERQQFQIVFYNEAPFVLVNDNGRFDCFFGSDSQRRDAVRQISRVRSGGGTNHESALQAALELAPDVVFLLTDGEEPPLSDSDVDGIVQGSRGARIHCIQFGNEPEPPRPSGNWLQKLAKETGGQYVYQDVTRLEQ
jgi:hypothetical protein